MRVDASVASLDVILGAFAAGFVLRFILPEGHQRTDDKLNAIAYGFFIPIFFVESGMKIDLPSVGAAPTRLVICVLALVAGLVLRGAIPDGELTLMLRAGLCGGFTTFSTFSFETFALLQDGAYGLAIAYATGSGVLCVAAALAGDLLARALHPAA